eukprot:1102537-Pelagomonas_calceolata.AAC.1
MTRTICEQCTAVCVEYSRQICPYIAPCSLGYQAVSDIQIKGDASVGKLASLDNVNYRIPLDKSQLEAELRKRKAHFPSGRGREIFD